MKTVEEFLSEIGMLDIKLWVEGDRLKFNAPKGAMTPELVDQLRARKAELIAFLKDASHKTSIYSIEKTPDAEHYPVSNAQRRLWLLSQMGSGNEAYNMPWALAFEGELDRKALEQAFMELIKRHESLRTSFVAVEGGIRQKIEDAVPFQLQYTDLSAEDQSMERVRALARKEAVRPFDLEKTPLIRVSIVKISPTRHVMIFNMHHIISDGWSISVMVREFRLLYDAFRLGNPSPLSPLRIQYRDYAVWQNRLLECRELETHRRYWHEKLSGEIPVLDLPSDFPRPPFQTFKGDTVSFRLSSDQTQRLRQFSRERRASLFMVMLAAVKVLLYRYTSQEDIIIGSPVAGRVHPDLENQIGFYLSTIVLRDRIHGDMNFSSFLDQVKKTATEAFDHQIYPFDRLVDEMNLKRDVSRSPFFDILLIMQNIEPVDLSLPGLNISMLEHDIPTSKFDLTFEFFDGEDQLPVNLKFNTDIFQRDRIERMGKHLQVLLDSILENADRPIGQLNIMTKSELERVLYEFNDTVRNYPADKTIIDLIEQQVERTPDSTAIIFENESCTYAELNRRANRFAHYLGSMGVGSGAMVGVLMERSMETAAALLGILKSGTAYVAMDPDFPPERLDFMAKDAGIAVLLAQEQFSDRFDAGQIKIITIENDRPAIDSSNETNPENTIAPDQPAYVVYTSGSTGLPKGVLNTHLGLFNHLKWRQEYFQLDSSDRVLHKTMLNFDNSLWEIFWPLTAGAVVVMAQPGGHKDASYLKNLIQDSEVTTAHFVPSMLRIFLEIPGVEECRSLRRLFSGGEALSPELLEKCSERLNVKHYHLYGQSEAAMNTSCRPCDAYDRHTVSIGRPIANTRFYILDKHLNPLPIGIPGELHIAGKCLAKGYLNRPELNSEKFIPDPFDNRTDSRLFKTGDRCCLTADGNIRFLGRTDAQVKIRGFRIEPGEIERCLLAHEAVANAAVVAMSFDDNPELTAYVAPSEKFVDDFDINALRNHLRKILPDYMIPSYFVRMDSLPMTPSGKLDRKSLPHPSSADMGVGTQYVAPRNALERQLAVIWEEILEVERVGIKDNFFDLGGHSLRAARLVSRIHKDLGAEIPMGEIFIRPTVSELAERIASGATPENDPTQPFSPLACIQPYGDKVPLFFMHIARGDVFCYAELARKIGREHPFYGLRAFGLDPGTSPLSRIEDMAAKYIEAIRSVYPKGPYVIGGHSRGGVISYEMAQQLLDSGESVPLLVFIDAFAPDYLERPKNLWENFLQFKHVIDMEKIPAFYSEIRGDASIKGIDDARVDFLSLSEDEKLDVIWQGAMKSKMLDEDITDVDTDLQRRILKVSVESSLSVAKYQNIRPYSGRIAFFPGDRQHIRQTLQLEKGQRSHHGMEKTRIQHRYIRCTRRRPCIDRPAPLCRNPGGKIENLP